MANAERTSRYARTAPTTIKSRWTAEEQIRRLEIEGTAQELINGSFLSWVESHSY